MKMNHRVMATGFAAACLSYVVAAAFLVAFWWPVPAHPQPAPPQAVAAGFGGLTFNGAFTSATVDVNKTYAPGFSWYATTWRGTSTPNPITFNADGSATINGDDAASAGIQMGTATFTAPCCTFGSWTGIAFGGGGYFEAEISFDPAVVDITHGWPAFWADSLEYMAHLPGRFWVGQDPAYVHHVEVDALEFIPPGGHYTATHDRYGILGTTCPPGDCDAFANFNVTPAVDWKSFQRVGFLWKTATPTTTGYIKFYLNDVQVGPTRSWTQFTGQVPPPGYPAVPWTWGYLDQTHLVIMLGSGLNQPMRVRNVLVWQGQTANNLVR